MTSNLLDHQLTLEALQEYDLGDIVEALCQVHDAREISRLLESRLPQAAPIDSWETQNCVALADSIIEACQNTPDTE